MDEGKGIVKGELVQGDYIAAEVVICNCSKCDNTVIAIINN